MYAKGEFVVFQISLYFWRRFIYLFKTHTTNNTHVLFSQSVGTHKKPNKVQKPQINRFWIQLNRTETVTTTHRTSSARYNISPMCRRLLVSVVSIELGGEWRKPWAQWMLNTCKWTKSPKKTRNRKYINWRFHCTKLMSVWSLNTFSMSVFVVWNVPWTEIREAQKPNALLWMLENSHFSFPSGKSKAKKNEIPSCKARQVKRIYCHLLGMALQSPLGIHRKDFSQIHANGINVSSN